MRPECPRNGARGMRSFLSALRRYEKNKLVEGRKRTLAKGESRRFTSRMAHEESRLSRSVGWRFWYTR